LEQVEWSSGDRGGATLEKRHTIKDVAKIAGVSIATVSRVATGSSRVREEVAQRVKAAAGKLGVDLQRRSKGKVLAFILSNRPMLHPFHSHILVGAEAQCAQSEWSMLFLTLSYPTTARWRDLHIPRILERRDLVSGFIVAGTTSQNLLDLLDHERLPFAVLGNNVLGDWRPEKHDVLWFDDIQGAAELSRYLLSLGHRDIWFVGNTRLPWFSRRYEGYRLAMQEAGLEPRLSEVDTERDQELGYLATKSLLARNGPVSAIFAGGDPTAEGVCKALRDCALRIPEDVSVVGFNDIESAMLHPPLTTVHVFTEQIGKRLAQMVLNRIEYPQMDPQHLTIPTQLVKRESCRTVGTARESTAIENTRGSGAVA
jgi:DNA-binding LacI/PurR family transcriptional regulator